MKVETTNRFNPVTLTLESEAELYLFVRLLGALSRANAQRVLATARLDDSVQYLATTYELLRQQLSPELQTITDSTRTFVINASKPAGGEDF